MRNLLQGIVISLDKKTQSGIIKDVRGIEWLFYADECCDQVLPQLNQFVRFERDMDYKSTPVACLITQVSHIKAAA